MHPRLGASPERPNIAYASQLSHEAIVLGLTDETQFRLSLVLNALFFDQLALSAASLLSHPLLYDLSKEQPEGMARLYRDVVRPVAGGDHATMQDVAAGMIRDNTIHALGSRDHLLKHASWFDLAHAQLLFCPHEDMRRSYYATMVELVSVINRNGLSTHSLHFEPGCLGPFATWLERDADRDDLRCSAIYRFADHTGGSAVRLTKVLGEVGIQVEYAGTQGLPLSTSGTAAALVDLIDELGSESQDTSSPTAIVRHEDDDVVVRIPFDDLSRQPLDELLELRDHIVFRDLRAKLASYRLGKARPSRDQMQTLADSAATVVVEYALSNRTRRKRLLTKAKSSRHAVLKLVGVGAASEVLSHSLDLFLPQSSGHLSLALALGLVAAGTSLKRRWGGGAPLNQVFPEKGTVEYSAVTGAVSEPR